MELGANPMPNGVNFSYAFWAHVCTDDIDSLQSAMQIFIDRVYTGKDMDKQDKNTMHILLWLLLMYRVLW